MTDIKGELSDAVRSTAMLADVSISMWSAERSDATIMEEVKRNTGAQGNVGRVVKNLLAGHDGMLKDVRSAYAVLRTIHYNITLPWVSDPHATRQTGARLLPNVLFQRYLTEMSAQKRKAEALRDSFVAEYPALAEQARQNLGGMAAMSDYPQPEQVRSSFRASFDFEPIPATNDFRGLPDHVMDKLSRGLKAKQVRMVETAQAAMWETVGERVRHIVERLSAEDAKFKSTTVENVRELVTLLPGWNVAGDPRVAEVVAEISTMLDGVTAKDLRDDTRIRKQVTEQAAAVVDKLSKWGL